ncbi:MAG: N-acetyl-gamma-glutamyl-phosphate reductase [Treponema sp.]|jgi:N-acetyl-gamma-glutamyl-phosphate reductase|nr:N-acetyl-gamma-glutamyl-phosphate reductase [Treponema sp.]
MIAGIIGATGYAGAELTRLLSAHPCVSGLALASVSFEGKQIESVYPNFTGKIESPLLKPEEAIAKADIVFSALPHGAGEPYAKACMGKGIHFIDLSADFRFGGDEETFSAWYGKPYTHPELRSRSVYGLPELNRKKILELKSSGPVIIANPGCYPTGASLGAFPALAKPMAADETIIVDSATGISGGGREPQSSFHFPECSDAVSAYKVGAHRHCPEISLNLKAMAALSGSPAPPVIFTPHLAPMNRGILSTIYIPLLPKWRVQAASASRPPGKEIEAKAAQIRDDYAAFYKDEPFVRVLPQGFFAATNRVRQSNFCDISVHLDCGGRVLVVVSAIDNMVKGAAGQAVQNMNILMGFEEAQGLGAIPASF